MSNFKVILWLIRRKRMVERRLVFEVIDSLNFKSRLKPGGGLVKIKLIS